jgi:hypothetical protein
MGPAMALRAVHFLYPSDIIGVIFHHHRGAPPRERRTASTPASWRGRALPGPWGALWGDSQRLGMECVPTMGHGSEGRAATRWEEDKR